jgi:5'-3' exonuclease
MGIKNLNNLLRKNCPGVFEEIHLSEYAFKKIAIDVSLFMCKFKAICGDRWLSSFVNLVECLRRNEIHCVFIYDNGAPHEKTIEKEERIKQREKTENKVLELEIALDKYHNTGEIDTVLLELHEKIEKKSVSIKSFLDRKQKSKIGIDMNLVKDKIEKMRNYIIKISPTDFETTRTLFDILNIPYYIAPLEAECMCADLCKRGIVDGVLSEDTDVLAYGSDVLLTKIDTKNDTCVRVKSKDVLDGLKLTQEQFLDLCIMCGCDYNKNIPKVGCETSFKYITKYKSIDEIARNIDIDISILNHKRTRELFTEYERHEIKDIKYCGVPDFEILKKFIKENNIRVDLEKLKNSFIHEITFIEKEDEEKVEFIIE